MKRDEVNYRSTKYLSDSNWGAQASSHAPPLLSDNFLLCVKFTCACLCVN